MSRRYGVLGRTSTDRIEVVDRWSNDLVAARTLLVSRRIGDLATALTRDAAGLIAGSDQVSAALGAIAAGLRVRCVFTPGDLSLCRVDAVALSLRHRGHDYVDIGAAVGYSSRQVRRRLNALADEHRLGVDELVALGSVVRV